MSISLTWPIQWCNRERQGEHSVQSHHPIQARMHRLFLRDSKKMERERTASLQQWSWLCRLPIPLSHPQMSTALSLEFFLSDEWSGLGLVSGEIQTESVSSAEYKFAIVCSPVLFLFLVPPWHWDQLYQRTAQLSWRTLASMGKQMSWIPYRSL